MGAKAGQDSSFRITSLSTGTRDREQMPIISARASNHFLTFVLWLVVFGYTFWGWWGW